VLDGARAVQGIGAAAMFASTLAILADAFPDAGERARAFAAYGATIGGSFALGPLVGGALTSGLGWRAIFFVNLPLGAACMAATLVGVRESRDPNPRRPDWAGQVLLSAGLFVLVLLLLRGNTDGWGSLRILGLGAAAVVLLGVFVLVEHRRAEPMLPLAMFRNPSFTGAQVAAFAISGSFFALFFYCTVYLQAVLHLTPIRAGLVYLPSSALVFVVSGASAQLLQKVSLRSMIGGGLGLVAAGLATCTLTGAHSSWIVLLPGLVLCSVGTGLFNPALSAVALGEVDPSQSGLAAGVNDAFRNVGIAVGVAALGALIPASSAIGGSPEAFVTGFHRALVAGTLLAATGAAVAIGLIRTGERAPAAPTESEPAAEPSLA
jgi:predicted MFS family arabinose efflux permease